LCTGALYAQDNPIFRAGVSLVHVDAEVTQNGRLISGLGRDDFRVKDEGLPQSIVQFSADEQALDLILLFDVSGSMRTVVSRVASAAREALQELRAGDRVAVMVFSSHSRVILPFTEDLDRVDRAIHEDVLGMRFRGATFIQSAM